MKRLVALMMCAVSLGAAAQFPNLPYNPDENGDGLIGVADLQGLLSNYGSEFEGAVSSNGVALVRLPNSGKIECSTSCENLPGPWKSIDLATAEKHFDLLTELVGASYQYGTGPQNYFWSGEGTSTSATKYYSDDGVFKWTSTTTRDENACVCSVKERPKLEYLRIGQDGDIAYMNQAVNELLDEGWYIGSVDDIWLHFWRWAE